MSSLSLSQSRRADGSAPDRLPWSHSNCWLIREQLTVFNYNTSPCTDHTIIPVNMCSAILLFLIISHLKYTLHLKKWWITCYSKDICLLVLFLEEHPNSSKKQWCFCRCSTVLFSIILIKRKAFPEKLDILCCSKTCKYLSALLVPFQRCSFFAGSMSESEWIVFT